MEKSYVFLMPLKHLSVRNQRADFKSCLKSYPPARVLQTAKAKARQSTLARFASQLHHLLPDALGHVTYKTGPALLQRCPALETGSILKTGML